MGKLLPFRGIYANPEFLELGDFVCPPYDVLSPELRTRMYGHGMRNVVRVESGLDYPGDVEGVRDRYSRAAEHLASWRMLSIVKEDSEPCFYVVKHTFPQPDASQAEREPGALNASVDLQTVRYGVLCTVPALPWSESPVRPHEKTHTAPKEDRLRLFRATNIQPSGALVVARAPDLGSVLVEAATQPPFLSGGFRGEMGAEEVTVFRVGVDSKLGRQIGSCGGNLYMADGHHRYETAAAYGKERGTPVAMLSLVVPADDPGLFVLPTHRILTIPGVHLTMEQLLGLSAGVFTVEPVVSRDAMVAALAAGPESVLGVVVQEGYATVRPVDDDQQGANPQGEPTKELAPAVADRVVARVISSVKLEVQTDGTHSVAYSRSLPEVEHAVKSGESCLGVVVPSSTLQELFDVADRQETMPQKSTYFYPKVPAGIVMAPL